MGHFFQALEASGFPPLISLEPRTIDHGSLNHSIHHVIDSILDILWGGNARKELLQFLTVRLALAFHEQAQVALAPGRQGQGLALKTGEIRSLTVLARHDVSDRITVDVDRDSQGLKLGLFLDCPGKLIALEDAQM